jgi:predicted RNA-binding protein YlxR (DUF448 family)
VRTPTGAVVVDQSGRVNGRGAYVCRDEHCIIGATSRGTLSRALESPIPPGLRDELHAASGLAPEVGQTNSESGGSGGKE